MAKLTSDDFNKKYSELIVDNDDLLLQLMEDFADSVSSGESEELASLRKELEDAQMKVKDITERYKARFLSMVEDVAEVVPESEEVEEKEVIDVKEI